MNTIDKNNAMNGKSGRIAGVTRLVAAGALALSLAVSAAPPAGSGPGDGPGRHGGKKGAELGMLSPRMLAELKLTPDQEKRLKDEQADFKKKKTGLRDEKVKLETELKALFSAYPVNNAEIMKTGEKVADVDRRITLLRIESMSRLLSGLTPEQHKKFQELKAKWKEKHKGWKDGGKDKKNWRKDRKDKQDGSAD